MNSLLYRLSKVVLALGLIPLIIGLVIGIVIVIIGCIIIMFSCLFIIPSFLLFHFSKEKPREWTDVQIKFKDEFPWWELEEDDENKYKENKKVVK